MQSIPISHRLFAFLIVVAVILGTASIANALPVSGRDLAQSIICKVFSDLQARGLYNRGLAARCNIIPPPTTAKLVVVKSVQGSTTTPSAFTLQVVSGSATTTFSGNASGTILTFAGNSVFTVSESPVTDFSPSFSSGCSGTLLPNSTTTCTVINTFTGTTTATTSTLRIVKIVEGGIATSSDFQISLKKDNVHVTGSPQAGSSIGTTYSNLASSTYEVSETGPANYDAVFSGACNGTSTIMLAASTSVTCTVTNTFNPPLMADLTVFKIVLGTTTATSSDFQIHVKSATTSLDVAGSPQAGTAAGTTYSLPFGTYEVSETGDLTPDETSFNGDCSTNGGITLTSTTTKACTVTNTFNNAP
ncbi:MAG: hypothetical protein UY63_C0005G0031 [Parcubacteria group bacterium GW2011_GWA2_51_10]|nr:MAG: hypothetical protein UY63_C0005G0031 [Parcubacteria group bacterium GW2011_GWA2_51_10]